MAVPKRKMGRARTHARRSTNDKIAAPARSICPQCGEVKLPHRVCGNCGYYRDREVIVTVAEAPGSLRDVGKASSHAKLDKPGLPGGFLAIGPCLRPCPQAVRIGPDAQCPCNERPCRPGWHIVLRRYATWQNQ